MPPPARANALRVDAIRAACASAPSGRCSARWPPSGWSSSTRCPAGCRRCRPRRTARHTPPRRASCRASAWVPRAAAASRRWRAASQVRCMPCTLHPHPAPAPCTGAATLRLPASAPCEPGPSRPIQAPAPCVARHGRGVRRLAGAERARRRGADRPAVARTRDAAAGFLRRTRLRLRLRVCGAPRVSGAALFGGAAARYCSPASSDGPAGLWAAPRTQEERPSRQNLHEGCVLPRSAHADVWALALSTHRWTRYSCARCATGRSTAART